MTLPPIVVFDLDGTLAETAPDLVAVLNMVMDREGMPAVPFEKARDMIGAGARALIERGFEAAGVVATPAKSDELFRLFLQLYEDHLCVGSHLYPELEDALDELARRGFTLAVCTNKIERHSKMLLERLGVAGRFRAICGRDTFPWFKPDPRHLTLTIEAAGGDPRRAVMVGDSLTDITTAKEAGIPVVAVPFGYSDRPVREYGPDRLIERFGGLVPAVESLIGRV